MQSRALLHVRHVQGMIKHSASIAVARDAVADAFGHAVRMQLQRHELVTQYVTQHLSRLYSSMPTYK
jgi:hypothetical protein